MCFRHHLENRGCQNLSNRACLYNVCVVQRIGGVVRHKIHAHFFPIIPPAIDYYWERWLTWMLRTDQSASNVLSFLYFYLMGLSSDNVQHDELARWSIKTFLKQEISVGRLFIPYTCMLFRLCLDTRREGLLGIGVLMHISSGVICTVCFVVLGVTFNVLVCAHHQLGPTKRSSSWDKLRRNAPRISFWMNNALHIVRRQI